MANGWNTLGVTPQWDAVNAVPHLKDQFGKLGYTGEMYGYGEDGLQLSSGLQDWLSSNKYSLQGRDYGSDLQMRIADANGQGVGDESHYNSNDAGWFEKAVPMAIGAMGLGALGYGSGLLGGGDVAALGADQIGAMNGNPFLTTELSGLTAPTAAELAAITPSIPSLNPFLAAGISGLAAPTAAELAAITPTIPAAAGGAGLLSSLGGLKSILPAVGAIAGATGASGDQKQTTQNQLDPRMAAMLYGQGGFLGQAQDYFNSTKGGNALMNQGADAMKAAFTNPQAQQGFNAMQTQGMGLLGGGSQNDFLDAFKNRKTSAMPDLSQFKQPRGLLG